MSDRLQELLDTEVNQTSQIDELQNRRKVTRQEIAELKCPHRIGGTLISRKGIKAKVVGISYFHGRPGYSLRICGIKKDGKPYKNSFPAYSWDGWEAYKE